MRSRARRWARVVDEATWPEVLRRYLLATRATLPQPSAVDLSADPALLDDDVIAVCAAELLAGRPYYRCSSSRFNLLYLSSLVRFWSLLPY